MGVELFWNTEQVVFRINHLIKGLGPVIQDNLIQGGLQVELKAKHRAPKQYGFLRASIGHTDSGQVSGNPKGKVPQIIGWWKEEFLSIEVGSGMVYARAQEYGSFAHKEGQSPYLTPSLAEIREPLLKAISADMQKVCNGN